MTKEELEKEAVRYCTSNCGDCYGCHKKYRKNKNCERLKSMIKTYLTSAEPREKQIQIDAEHIIALQKQNGELTDKLTKAKEIIKTFLGFAEAFGYSPSMDKFITDTEQFISEVKK